MQRLITAATVCAGFSGAVLMTDIAPAQPAEKQPVSVTPVYRTPPDAIVRALTAAPLPAVSLDPTRRTMVLADRVSLPPIEDLAQPMLRLAGSRINPANNGPFGPRALSGFTIKSVAPGADFGKERRVELPPDSDVSMPNWSPDGSRFAFVRTERDTVQLWVVDVASATARLLGDGINTASGAGMRWMPDGRLLVRFIPSDRGEKPREPLAPSGPVIQETSGVTAQVRTFQDMLRNPHDEAMFDWVMQTQLALVDPESGERVDLGQAGTINLADPSPDGRYVLVSRTLRPYSYQVPSGLFPESVEVWETSSGRVVSTVAAYPLREDIPIQGVQRGPRGFRWIDVLPATLMYVEALDNGDPKNKVPHRDRVMTLAEPFATAQGIAAGAEWLKTEHRFTGATWLEPVSGAPARAMVSEFDRDRRWTRTWLAQLPAGGEAEPVAPRLVFDRSVNDSYNNPGSPLMTRLANGRSAIRVIDDGDAVHLAGAGATPEGDRPFLDRMDLATLDKQRLWRNAGESYESVVDVLPGGRVMLAHETPTTPPNYFLVDLASGERTGVTDFRDPVPELRRVKKELVKYTRADGVELSATMYLPADYQPGTKLPLLVWAYPLEFNDASTAGQVTGSPFEFTRIGGISHLFLLTQGYAVMDDATMPIVGDPETMNDTFIEQIAASAQAAIDKAVEMGVADRERVAVGGHSYGAFMTANLLAHTDLFRAGVARSGAYNRTLTPFGFQGERRTFWEAKETYDRLSPFTFAHKINEPILLIHGANDSNPGTFPMQSERLFAAIKGNGGTARLVMLPYEDHGYSAKESIFHQHAEIVDWLDRTVKHAAPRQTDASATQTPQTPPG